MKLTFIKRLGLLWKNIILMILGILMFFYFARILILTGRFDVFNFLASLTGFFMVILSFKLNSLIVFIKKCPKLIQYTLKVLFASFLISFVICQSLIIYGMRETPKPGADYIIILGCQVIGEYASVPLLSRGFTAIRYLYRNPETRVIVTGGQGPGGNISEAEALRRLLLENRIDRDRILMEDRSTNTMENLIFANELFNLLDKNIVIVTSDYHIFRALSIARRLNYQNVSGLPSRSRPRALPAFLLREYLAIIHNLIFRRI
ncbi:MAG: YdcF family protein [Spirochaetes bacterium]|nr:YdcF family protein [Spirochaetota bacterium]